MPRLIVFLLLVTFYLGFDTYTYYGLSSLIGTQSFFCRLFCGTSESAEVLHQHSDTWIGVSHEKIFWVLYWLTTVLVFLGFYKVYYDLQNFTGGVRKRSTNFLLGFGFAIIVAKVIFSLMLIFHDGGRAVYGIVEWAYVTISAQDTHYGIPNRNIIITSISAIIAILSLVGMIYGVIYGKYRYVVDKVEFVSPDLPPAFHGMKIIQISDIHAGTFDSVARVEDGIQMIQNQEADLILFTGDLINSHKDEIAPFISSFAQLSAPDGMYSVMGNHDYYGLYRIPKADTASRSAYLADFHSKQNEMGFTLLNNEAVRIHRGASSITIAGVENWGAGPFPKLGDLDLALQLVPDDQFVVMMSHDPTHWDHHILTHPKKVHLTLAGHTHGMQFGVNLLGIKWSPVKYRYKRWMGMYTAGDESLYVNRGFGFLGWPGRVGMRPEITLITLKSS